VATYHANEGTEVNSVDQAGNPWPKPLTFPKSGELKVPDDQQDVIIALDAAAATVASPIKRVKE
jgi:ABC-type cobalt transport system substrate-binding protein